MVAVCAVAFWEDEGRHGHRPQEDVLATVLRVVVELFGLRMVVGRCGRCPRSLSSPWSVGVLVVVVVLLLLLVLLLLSLLLLLESCVGEL